MAVPRIEELRLLRNRIFMNHETMPRIHFYKMTGTGNDFILIDNRKRIIDSDNCQDFVRSICRNKVSVGADGVILIENDSEVDFRWRFFNSDGSEPDMCGNGSRCAARFAYLAGIVDSPRMAFRTNAGIIKAELWDTKVKVQMPVPHSMKKDLHIEVEGRSFNLDFINSGVPHAVCFLKDQNELEEFDVQRWGRTLRLHPHFQPEGTNVDFVWIRNDRQIMVRTYERGVEGETLACGTGCIASVLMSAIRNQMVSPVEVQVRSGELLTIYFHSEFDQQLPQDAPFKEVCLEGEARIAYEADLWYETLG
jgi:diaminopimelate epimerase